MDNDISIHLGGGADAIQIDPILIFRRNDVFENAPEIFVEQASLFFESIKDEIAESTRARMREWRGEEKRDLSATIFPGAYNNVSLVVAGDLVQTFTDEFGLPARKIFPPYGKDSLLFQWVVEVLAPQPLPIENASASEEDRLLEAQLNVTFAVALAINQRGLPAPSDYLHQPFMSTFNDYLPRVLEGLVNAGRRAASIINTNDQGIVEVVVHR